jgi:hypothetical protein
MLIPALAVGVLMATTGHAWATGPAVDYSTLASGVVTEVSGSIPLVLGSVGALLGIGAAGRWIIGMVKRTAK